MVLFLGAAMVMTRLAVETLKRAGRVKPNPNRIDLPANFHVWREATAERPLERARTAFGTFRDQINIMAPPCLLNTQGSGKKASRFIPD
ncbi:hypothetical protein RLO149_c037440 [Roseobacter litoralis Och 149]|uniref:Uncharacterized protein n=2 Tax=Roseobacter litoralis TaxID=42443 RepID=F7ZC85_ROSLO|nr:hypothetical protein RLO149_c037440 [Roseobacter litoralis Och 149]